MRLQICVYVCASSEVVFFLSYRTLFWHYIDLKKRVIFYIKVNQEYYKQFVKLAVEVFNECACNVCKIDKVYNEGECRSTFFIF